MATFGRETISTPLTPGTMLLFIVIPTSKLVLPLSTTTRYTVPLVIKIRISKLHSNLHSHLATSSMFLPQFITSIKPLLHQIIGINKGHTFNKTSTLIPDSISKPLF